MIKNSSKIARLLGLAATLLLPGFAHAQILLDTGAPPSPAGTNYIVSAASSIAAEFSATAGETVTQLSAYLAPNAGGSAFTFDIYSGLRTTGNRVQPVYIDNGTFTSTGWTSSTANWIVPATGNYWIALQATTGNSFDAPAETSTSTGTVPALAFASSSTSSYYYTLSSSPIGLQVTATPEPTSWVLALVCAGMFYGLRRLALFRSR
jgi:hypothetical protein